MFKDIVYLKTGSVIQQRSYNLLTKFSIMELLMPYNPILIGTIPLDIALAGSDLDIACEVYDLVEFEKFCLENFKNHKDYRFKVKSLRGKEVGIANFKIADMPVELYAEGRPVVDQYGYRHLIKEFEILEKFGVDFKKQIMEFKSKGMKTEPAFAKLLGLQGDPYESLLNYHINE